MRVSEPGGRLVCTGLDRPFHQCPAALLHAKCSDSRVRAHMRWRRLRMIGIAHLCSRLGLRGVQMMSLRAGDIRPAAVGMAGMSHQAASNFKDVRFFLDIFLAVSIRCSQGIDKWLENGT